MCVFSFFFLIYKFLPLAFASTGFDNVTDNDCINVRYICECISRRSAVLVAAALAALVNKINQPFVTIGIDGSVYNEHPHYHHILTTTIMKLLKRGVQVTLSNERLIL